MTDIEWKDATSYSSGERGNIEPTAWECTIGGIRVYVSNAHIYHRGTWVMHCYEFGIDTRQIGNASEMTAEQAQAAALHRAAAVARKRREEIDLFIAAVAAAK